MSSSISRHGRSKRLRLTLLFVTLFSTLLVVQTPGVAAENIADDFNDNLVDPTLWVPAAWGTGTLALERNGRLENVMLAAASKSGHPSGGFGAGFISGCPLTGDFDIQVDFQLLTWPYSNGVRVKLSALRGRLGPMAGTLGAEIERTSLGRPIDFPWEPLREIYLSNFQEGHTVRETYSFAGSLRLIRQGAIVTGLYSEGDSWEILRQSYITSDDLYFSLYSGSNDDAFTDRAVVTAFDNFTVNSGTLKPVLTQLSASAVINPNSLQPSFKADLNPPAPNQTIAFYRTHPVTGEVKLLCTGQTNSAGSASCSGQLNEILGAVEGLGYRAEFGGNRCYLPSFATGLLVNYS